MQALRAFGGGASAASQRKPSRIQLLREGVRAEAEHEKDEDTIADNVLTDNIDESYNAGRHATPTSPVHIDLDLGAPTFIDHLELMPYQVPTPAVTHHRIWVDGQLVAELQGETRHHHTLLVPEVQRHGRHIRVETVQSPSWVAWSKINVFGAPVPGREG